MSAPIEVVNFGCRLNAFEAEIMKRRATEAGLDGVTVIHSCAVTAEAERQTRQAIRRARRADPGRRVVVTGCSAEIDPARYRAMAEVDDVVSNQTKLRPSTWRALAGDEPGADEGDALDRFEGRTRGIVKVQDGCDHRCTFCIIPYGRGASRSAPPDEVIAQTRRLVEGGHREVVFTGVDLTSYGPDLGDGWSLGKLAKAVLCAVPDLRRLRISSIDPAEIDEDLLDLAGDDERLAAHLHLSVQAGDDMVLKRMKRRHGRDDVIALAERFRALRPTITFGADLIAGFPTEDDAMHQKSLDLIEEAGLSFLHVFPYSERPGTPASRMPSVPKEIRKERAAALRAAGERAHAALLAREIGETRDVLIERGGVGRSSENVLYQAPDGFSANPGAFVRLAGVEAMSDRLLAGGHWGASAP